MHLKDACGAQQVWAFILNIRIKVTSSVFQGFHNEVSASKMGHHLAFFYVTSAAFYLLLNTKRFNLQTQRGSFKGLSK